MLVVEYCSQHSRVEHAFLGPIVTSWFEQLGKVPLGGLVQQIWEEGQGSLVSWSPAAESIEDAGAAAATEGPSEGAVADYWFSTSRLSSIRLAG